MNGLMPETKMTSAQRRSQTVNAMLDATAELLTESTRIEVSLSMISSRSGVNSAMIKYYFGNKEGLLVALLEREAEAAMGALDYLVKMDITAQRKLRIHIEGIVNSYFRSPYLNRLIHYLSESGQPASRHRITQVFTEPMIRAYTAIIEQGVREGTMQNVDPALLYYALVGSAEHIFYATYSVQSTLGVSRLDEKLKRRYLELISNIFTAGLAAP